MHFRPSINLLFIITILFGNCKQDSNPKVKTTTNKSKFEVISSSESGISFSNDLIEDDNNNFLHYGYFYNGAGVAAGDINNDGLTDLYFSSNLDFNKLYLNLGNFKFKDITESADVDGGLGYKSGVTMVDINTDGWLDIFVCKTAIQDTGYRQKILYINNKNGTFTERAKEYGLDDRSYSTQAYFFDSDLDGDLDVYFVNHPMNFDDNNYIQPKLNSNQLAQSNKSKSIEFISDRLYENRNGKFIDISKEANILNEAFGLSAVIGDFNNDRLPDVYVANDFLQPDYLYINLGKNKFKEDFSHFFQHCPFSSMGSDFADINNDGCLDLITVDMTPADNYRQKNLLMTQNFDRYQLMLASGLKAQFSINSMQLGSCGSSFSDIAFLTQCAYTDWSWSPLLADFDNDGNKDIFITNGYLHDVMHSDYNRYKLDSLEKLFNSGLITQLQWLNNIPSVKTKDYFFKNIGNLSFSDESNNWNSGPATFSHGACYADLDNDGDLDLVVNNVNDPATLLKNNSSEIDKNNFIRFSFSNLDRRLNDGVRVQIENVDLTIQTQTLQQTRGFLSKVEDVLHFGIGKNTSITRAVITWPDNRQIILKLPEINKLHLLNYNSSKSSEPNNKAKPFFEDITNRSIDGIKHLENNYIDFKREPLLLHKLSEEGPAIAVADINNDGLEDFYVGGSKGFPGKLYTQKTNGQYQLQPSTVFDEDAESEDVAAEFLDVNGDKLLDLYVVSGGNESNANDKTYQDRLYLNKGLGKFEKTKDVIPTETNSGSCITVADLDQDGDLDIFVGSRSIPSRYPEPPKHLLLINNSGIFSNEIEKLGSEINSIGMITDAQFADLNQDKELELILCGEFTPISVFKKQNNQFRNTTNSLGLEKTKGLWYSLQVVDLNKDNFPEIIAGNIGLNTSLHASISKPLELFYKDFDKNGTIDPILCKYNGEKSYPIHYRDRVLDQMVFLKKKFTRFEQYANATINDLFNKEQLNGVNTLTANTLSSIILMNQGGHSFQIQDLPVQCQFSPIQSIQSVDFNQDGIIDLITGGNFYGTDAQFGRYDASTSCLLQGLGNTNFKFIPIQDGGLNITGDIRGIYPIKSKGKIDYLFTRNNDRFSLVELNSK